MEAFYGILIPFLGTSLGAACVFFMKKTLSERVQRALTGFAAGVMVAASVWSLLIPAIEESSAMGKWSFVPAAAGFWIGILFLLALDHIIPHLHAKSGQTEGPRSRFQRTTMMVLAVTLHNIPEGLNSLFESTTPPADTRSTSSRGSSASSSRFTPSRTLKVVAPGAYNDAEAVSTALKLGNAVVLNLAATPDALAKRILDFSFGVASALDANVECVGNKVFALTRIDELTEAERSYLRTQGII